MSKAVLCTATPVQVEAIISDLQNAGFSSNDISVLMADTGGTRDFAVEHATKAPEGAATGAGSGAVVGGALGWLVGIGALAIPGLGPFIAAGPILAALSGAAVGGAIGGVAGALIGMGIPEFEAKQYEEKLKAGRSLVSVHSEDSNQTRLAQDIFARNGAEDITDTSEVAASGSERR